MKEDELSKKYLYIYVEYEDDQGGKLYCYRSDVDDLEKGDRVLVDRAGYPATARVVNKAYYDYFNAPYPVDDTKFIIDKISETYEIDDDDDDDMWSYEEQIYEYQRLIEQSLSDKIDINYLIDLMAPRNGEEENNLYYYPRLKLFFYHDDVNDEYSLPNYDYKLLTDEMFKNIIKDSLLVPQKRFAITTDEENYNNVIKFCNENNLEFTDNQDISDEKNKDENDNFIVEEDDLIFKYGLFDAWMFPIQELSIFNREKDNVIYKLINDDAENDDDYETNQVVTISDKDVKKIMTILIKNRNLYKINEIDFPPILDGSCHKFYFNNYIKSNIVSCWNIWYYLEDEEPTGNTKLLIDVFDEISDVLKKYGIQISLDDENREKTECLKKDNNDKINKFHEFIDIKINKDKKVEQLEMQLSQLTDGIKCYYSNIEFYIDSFKEDNFKIYYDNKSYEFNNFEDLVNYPLFDDKSIYDCILDITW